MLSLLLACETEPDASVPLHVDDGVELGEVLACADPAPATTYTEVGESWGLQAPLNRFDQHEESPSIATGDIDGDGLDDVVIVNSNGNSHQYRSTGAGFEVVDISKLITSNLGILLFDTDGDGDLDLMLGGATPRTLTNTAGTFSAGPALPVLPAETVGENVMAHEFAPGDLDGDGVLEFYVPSTYNFDDFEVQFNDMILKGGEDVWQYDVDTVPPAVGERHGMDALWFDADADGDQDVYVVNDFGMLQGSSTLLRNDGGVLTSLEESCYCAALFNAKGVDVDDFDGDGRVDIYVSANPFNTLFQQLADGTFVDVSTSVNAWAVDADATGWGGIFVDFDNDGQRDLFPAQGDRWNPAVDHPRVTVPMKLLRQDGGWFSDVAGDLGLSATGSFRAVSALDLNADGVEDLLITQIEDRPQLYLSDSCTEAGWLEVEAPIGSRVQVEAGGRTQTNWVKTDAGYQSHRAPRVHFGLGEAETIDRLTVTLPDGRALAATGIEARRRVVVPG